MSPCGRAPPSSLTSVLGPDGVLPRLRALLAEAAGAAVAAVVVMVVHLRLWRAPWRAPWSIDGDASFYLMVVRSLERHGWYLDNPNLGWPFGQTVHDLPQGVDNLHLVVLRVLAALTPTPAAAINLFYVLTFAGHETTAKSISNGIVGLSWYPDQRRELVGDLSLVPDAVEEFLRWDTVSHYLTRTPLEDTTLHGVTIPA